MNTGTLSGLDVLQFGKVEPGATVQLTDGMTAEVLQVRGRRLSRHGVISGSALVKALENGKQDRWVPSRDIAAVLRRPAPAPVRDDSGVPQGADAAPA